MNKNKSFLYEGEILKIVRDPNTNELVVTYVLSVELPDRDNEIVVIDGIDLTNYKNNPICLWNHNRDAVIGNGENLHKEVINGVAKLIADIRYHEVTQIGKDIAALAAKGVIKAVSIGYMLLETPQSIPVTDSIKAKYPKLYGDTLSYHNKTELLEFSVCSVPANPYATNTYDDNTKQLITKYFENNKMEIEDKSGAAISAANLEKKKSIMEKHKEGLDYHKKAMKCFKDVEDALKSFGVKDDDEETDSKDDSKSFKKLSDLELKGLIQLQKERLNTNKDTK